MTDRIGTIWADSISKDERQSLEFVRLGIIAGDGLIGEIITATKEIVRANNMHGVWEQGSPDSREVIEREENAWIAFWNVLKRLEKLGYD